MVLVRESEFWEHLTQRLPDRCTRSCGMRLKNVATQSLCIHSWHQQPGKCVYQLSLLEAYRAFKIKGSLNQLMKMPIMLANPSAESYFCTYGLLVSLKQTLPDSGLACGIHRSCHGRGRFSYRWLCGQLFCMSSSLRMLDFLQNPAKRPQI